MDHRLAAGSSGPSLSAVTLLIDAAEAAQILGVSRATVYRLVEQGRLPKARKHQKRGLDRGEVEAVSLERWSGPGHPYWAVGVEAAQILGVTRARVYQLREAGRIPAVQYGGRWFYRRPQLEVIANARDARKLA